MNSVDDNIVEPMHIDIENVVKHLFLAYPNANYIALNPSLNLHNAEIWKDHWYFLGFIDLPVYQELDGYPAWVANEDIHLSDDEWGLFFLHISSHDHYFRDIPLQASPTDFASPRFLCWSYDREKDELTQIISEEIPIDEKASKNMTSDFKDMINSLIINPAFEATAPKESQK